MTQLKVEIKSESAAFMDGNAAAEVARILRELADRIENTEHGGASLFDYNGNTCGHWSLGIGRE